MSLFMPEVQIEEISNTSSKKMGKLKAKVNSKDNTCKKIKLPKLPNLSIGQLKKLVKEIDIEPTYLQNEEVHIKEEYDIKPEFVEVLECLDDDEERQFVCPICKDEVQWTLPRLKFHYKNVHKGKRLRMSKLFNEGHPCEVCGKIFKSLSSIKDHLDTHNSYYHCNNCNSAYKKMVDYVIHLRTHCDEGVFKCLICEVTTEDINKITEHMNNAHVSSDDYKYWCQPCKKGFNMQSWYEEHENYHTGLKPFNCDFCDKSFMYSRFLHAHKRAMHRLEVPMIQKMHICAICKKEYQHRNSLKLHMNSHTGNYAICDICGKILSSKEKLKFHLRTHTGYKPFSCSYCGKSFTKKPILVEHVRIHTGERPYVCEYCTKAFSQRSSLVIHIRSHTGEKPYVCNFCTKGFVAKAMLNIHLKSCKGMS